MLSKYDFKIIQGSTFRRTFIWQESEDTPKDISGYTARMQLRKSYSSPRFALSVHD